MRKLWMLVPSVVLLAVSAGCSSPPNLMDEPVETKYPKVAPTLPAQQTIPTTAAPAITAAPASTVPETLPPTTVPAPPTTISLEAQVRAGWAEIQARRDACDPDPSQCDIPGVAAPDSPAFASYAAFFAERVATGHYVRAHAETVHVIEGVALEADGTSATIRLCSFDADWLMDLKDPLNASDDVVLNDETESRRRDVTVVLVDDGWRVFEFAPAEVTPGANTCAA